MLLRVISSKGSHQMGQFQQLFGPQINSAKERHLTMQTSRKDRLKTGAIKYLINLFIICCKAVIIEDYLNKSNCQIELFRNYAKLEFSKIPRNISIYYIRHLSQIYHLILGYTRTVLIKFIISFSLNLSNIRIAFAQIKN